MPRETFAHYLVLPLFVLPCVLAFGRLAPPPAEGPAKAPAPAKAAADLSPAEKVYGLSLLWKEAADHFAFFDKVPELDWDREYRDALPRVLATRSKWEYYRELVRLCALLKDGHTDVTPPADVGNLLIQPGGRVQWFQPHFGFTILDGKVYVTSVVAALERTGLLGAEVLAVGGVPVSEGMQQHLPYITGPTEWSRRMKAAMRLFAAPKGATRRLTVRTRDGRRKDVETPKYGPDVEGGWKFVPERRRLQLPPGEVQYKELDDGLAYVAVNSFADMRAAEEFDKLVPRLAKARGLLIDLRNNPGGNDAVGVRIVQHFTARTFKGFAARTREVRSAFRAWGQSVKPGAPNLTDFEKLALSHYRGSAWYHIEAPTYRGNPDARLRMPKVVLTSRSTASAAEDFLVFIDTVPNVTTVGEPTCGSTGQPYHFKLPGGGSARVCTHRVTFPDGRDFIGAGIVPKVLVKPSVEDLLSGRDVVYDKGVEVLQAMIRSAGR